MLARFAALFAVCLLGLIPVQARAQADVDRIAAVVNDDIVSIHDLEARLKLALVISNLPDTLENRRRAVSQVLRKMVDERLQTQEANRLKVTIASDEINRSIAGIEQQNHMPPGALLGSLGKQGVDIDAVKDQIKADLIWMKLTGRVLQSSLRVGEEEINERLDLLRQQQGRPEYLLAEIVLPAETPQEMEEAKRLGERLLDQLKAGAPFQALARQFSQSASAANGGMLGWVADSTLDDEVRDPISHLGKSEVSPLIRTSTGLTIVAMIDRRIAGANAVVDDSFSMVQVFFPTQGIGVQQASTKAIELTTPAKSCRDMEELGRKLNSDKSGRFDNARRTDLPGPVQKLVDTLADNKASPPQEAEGGLFVYMICSRSAGDKSGLPSREAVRRHIEDEKMDMLSKRYLRDLRRAAFVEFRL